MNRVLGYRTFLCLFFVFLFAPSYLSAQTAYPDEGVAYVACKSAQADFLGKSGAASVGGAHLRLNADFDCKKPSSGSNYFSCKLDSNYGSEWLIAYASCGNFYFNSSCLTRPFGNIGMVNGTQTPTGVCNNGCKMVPNFDAGTNLTLTDKANSNAIVIRNGTWRPSGDVCSVEPPQPPESPEYCHTVDGGYQVCKRKDQTCVVTPSGFRTCASDTGNLTGQVQTNNQRTEAAGISGPNSQANGPQNRPGENWQSAGPGASITNNNGGNIININNFNNAGQANGNQPVPGDGSAAGGNTATGSGSTNGTGSGTGSGDGGGNDDGNSPGGAGAGVGELYEGTDKTVLGIMQGFKSHVEASSFGSSVTSFMSVQGGGACPAISITASEWWDAMSFTAHCEGAFLAFLRAVGYVIFAMACYIAIKIAVT